ncbi:hypothetical protein ACF3NW_02490 [Eikenella halliae]
MPFTVSGSLSGIPYADRLPEKWINRFQVASFIPRLPEICHRYISP